MPENPAPSSRGTSLIVGQVAAALAVGAVLIGIAVSTARRGPCGRECDGCCTASGTCLATTVVDDMGLKPLASSTVSKREDHEQCGRHGESCSVCSKETVCQCGACVHPAAATASGCDD